jgi:hypothetical protein
LDAAYPTMGGTNTNPFPSFSKSGKAIGLLRLADMV